MVDALNDVIAIPLHLNAAEGRAASFDGRHADVRDGQGDDEEGPVSKEFQTVRWTVRRWPVIGQHRQNARCYVQYHDIWKPNTLDCQLQ